MFGLNVEGSQAEQATISGKAENPFKRPTNTITDPSPASSMKGNLTICVLLVVIAVLIFMHFRKAQKDKKKIQFAKTQLNKKEETEILDEETKEQLVQPVIN